MAAHARVTPVRPVSDRGTLGIEPGGAKPPWAGEVRAAVRVVDGAPSTPDEDAGDAIRAVACSGDLTAHEAGLACVDSYGDYVTSQRPSREPTPSYLSTVEQFIAAVVIVGALLAVFVPWQLDVAGMARWLPVIGGVVVFVATWVVAVRVVLRRRRDPGAKPAPEVSRRRQRIASIALLVGAIAIAIGMLID